LNGNQNIVDDNGIFNPSLSGAGSFDITYSVTEGSCTDIEPITITVVALPELGPISNLTLCANSPILDLTDVVPQNNVVFCFSPDELIVDGLFDPSEEGVGNYSLTAKLTNESNCTSELQFTIVVVEAFTAAGDPALSICTGGTPTLGAELTNGTGPFTYSWSNSGLLDDANSSTPSLNPGELQATTEFVATIVDDNDCIATATQTVNVSQQPSALVLSQSPICADEQSCLSAAYEGGVEPAIYNWSGGNIQSTDECDYLTDPITEATEFNLTLSFEADTYCNSVNEELNVIISSTPNPQVQNLPTTVCQGQQVVLFADNIISGSEVTWLVSPISAIEESSPSGQVFVLNISEDFNGDELSVSVQERYPSPSTCVWTNTFDVDVSNQIAAEPAEIFYSPINDVLVYNDSEPDCYQWGYFDSIPAPGDPSFVIIPGQTYQSFVPVVYDPDITYWCQAWYGDCNASASCANMSIRSSTVDSPLPIYSPEFLLYPNPNSGNFRLQMNNLFPEQEYELRVINALGQVISVQNFETYSKEAQVTVDLGEIASGLYHLGVYRNSQLEKMTPFIVDNQ
ncbi:MAG: T9SS type A sorting domain-containing protein, partial [Flavobacteriales bacterium]